MENFPLLSHSEQLARVLIRTAVATQLQFERKMPLE